MTPRDPLRQAARELALQMVWGRYSPNGVSALLMAAEVERKRQTDGKVKS